jgi:hypothetical protein
MKSKTVDDINKDNEEKYGGKIRECCGLYPNFCGCKRTTADILLEKMKSKTTRPSAGIGNSIGYSELIALLEEVVSEQKH